MWPVIGAVVVGALWARRHNPQTRITKSRIIGSRSGREWRLEYVPDLGTMIVYGIRARVSFRRAGEAGWQAERFAGDPGEVTVIRKDFEG